VKKKFEEWKRYYNQSYQDSYVPLALPGVFEFYVRLELLSWDPLKVSQQNARIERRDYCLTTGFVPIRLVSREFG
jgi:hypothetical protein